MIDLVAKAIEEAIDKPMFVVRVGIRLPQPNVWELWEGNTRVVSSNNHKHIENMCDILNYKYAAKKAIESLKDTPLLCYDDYKCDDVWKNLTSTKVWYLWYDAILKP